MSLEHIYYVTYRILSLSGLPRSFHSQLLTVHAGLSIGPARHAPCSFVLIFTSAAAERLRGQRNCAGARRFTPWASEDE